MLRRILVCCVLLNLPAWGWDDPGHRIIALIAFSRMTPAARAGVARILNVNAAALPAEMAKAATWPDSINKTTTRTAAWHFVDIPIKDSGATPSQWCNKSLDCLPARIEDFRIKLMSAKGAPLAPQQAVVQRTINAQQQVGAYSEWAPSQQMAFLIHLAGDAHQPFHVSTNGDSNGTCVRITGNYQASNLHALMDGDAVAFLLRGKPEAALVERLSGQMKGQAAALSVDQWITDAHGLGRKLYESLKLDVLGPETVTTLPVCKNLSARPVSPDLAQMSSVAERQLALAGAHLADLLNSMYR